MHIGRHVHFLHGDVSIRQEAGLLAGHDACRGLPVGIAHLHASFYQRHLHFRPGIAGDIELRT